MNHRGLGLLILVVVLIVVSFLTSRFMHYECPSCKMHFKKGMLDQIVKPHFFGQREQTCPHCGQTSLMTRQFGKE